MADFNAIKGRLVQTLSSDPTLTSSYEGQVWYNSTEGVLKGLVHIKATSSGGNLGTARDGLGAAGSSTLTAGLVFGGSTNTPGSSHTNTTEEYSGTSWSEQNNLGRARKYGAGFGTQTAAVYAGGSDYPNAPSDVEEYDGSSWSEVNNLPAYSRAQGTAGTLTAGLVFGGDPGSPIRVQTLEYDGTNWTAGNNLNTGRKYLAGCGTQTAAIGGGGNSDPGGPATTGATEEYDGTSWTSVNSFNNGRRALTMMGSQDHNIIAGGQSSATAIEEYDGTNWTTSPATLSTGRRYLSSFGTSTQGAIAGGKNGTVYNNTEEYQSNIAIFSASQAAVWTSGGNLGAGRYQMNGQNVGTKDAGLCIGGQGSFPSTAPAVTVSSTEEYNGSSWSEVNNTPTTLAMTGSVGVQTAALQFGGYGKPGGGPNPGPSSPNFSASNHYDGTNWTSGGALPSSVAYLTGAGTQTAAVSIGGYNASTTCNLYNGSTWTATGSMTTGRHNGSAVGISTAALIIGGAPVPGGVANDVEEFNGSTWSSSPDLPTNREQASVGGTTASAYAGHGNQPGTNVLTLDWNGTAWSSGVNASTYRYGGVSGGTSTTGGYFAGGGGSADGTQRLSTEEYSFPAVAAPTGVTSSTLTTS